MTIPPYTEVNTATVLRTEERKLSNSRSFEPVRVPLSLSQTCRAGVDGGLREEERHELHGSCALIDTKLIACGPYVARFYRLLLQTLNSGKIH